MANPADLPKIRRTIRLRFHSNRRAHFKSPYILRMQGLFRVDLPTSSKFIIEPIYGGPH